MFKAFFAPRSVPAPAAAAAGDGATAEEQDEAAAVPDPQVERQNKAVTQHIQKMDTIIRRKLHGTGAQYNMKLVIRGERGVGKSTLLRRLQGLPYEENYTPTPEIQTATINNWGYRGSKDVVKVEVWDVVDKGLARGGLGRVPEGGDLEDAVAGLPPDSATARGGRALAVLDASVVNVYQGASAVIFMVDPYRPETLDKVERALAEAPVNLPAVILLNFRDKLEEDAVAKAHEQPAEGPPAPPPPETPSTVSRTPPQGDEGYGADDVAAVEGDMSASTTGDGKEEGGDDRKQDEKMGAWGHVATLETAGLMMDRVREADVAEGRGSGRRISVFDCSMKNCFGLRVLYTYLNVPFLELKRQSLLQQAQNAAETLEREYRELEGFIAGHSYGNYMQHLQSSDVDPTAGRPATSAPPGRPSISSLPAPSALEEVSLERRGSVDSHGRKEKKKKHHKDKEKDKSKKKDRHRHKGSKSGKDERETRVAPEYAGRVTDAKEFAPVAKKTATEELDDFFGASSGGESDEGGRERRKVVKAIDPLALANAPDYDDPTDSDEMPAPATSRLKRVTAPVKRVAGVQPRGPPTAPARKAERSRVEARRAAGVTAASTAVATVAEQAPGRDEVRPRQDDKEADAVNSTARGKVSSVSKAGDDREKREVERASAGLPSVTPASRPGQDAVDGECRVDSPGAVTEEDHYPPENQDLAEKVARGEHAAHVPDDGNGSDEPDCGEEDTGGQQAGPEPEGKLGVARNQQEVVGSEGSGGVEGKERGGKQYRAGDRKVAEVSSEQVEPTAEQSKPAAEEDETVCERVESKPSWGAGGSTLTVSAVQEDSSVAELRADDQSTSKTARETDAASDGDDKGGVEARDSTEDQPDVAHEADEAANREESAGIDSERVAERKEIVTADDKANERDEIEGGCREQAGDDENALGKDSAKEDRTPGGDAPDEEAVVLEVGGDQCVPAESGGDGPAPDGGRVGGKVDAAGGTGKDASPGSLEDDFFAGGTSSGEGELYPGAAATSAVHLGEPDEEDGAAGTRLPPYGGPAEDNQPPSPRLIASSVAERGGFGYSRSPVGAQRKAVATPAASGVGEGLSEAARAAVAAALANASSAGSTSRSSSRREDDGGRSRKKKSRHKERRRKESPSGDEEEIGAAEAVDSASRRLELDSGRERRSRKGDGSSSRRHHRKSAI